MCNLGVTVATLIYWYGSYFNGSGVAVDKAVAVKWWKRAADAGDADSLKMLQSMR